MKVLVFYAMVVVVLCGAVEKSSAQQGEEKSPSGVDQQIEEFLGVPDGYGSAPVRRTINTSGPVVSGEFSERLSPQNLLIQACNIQFECSWQSVLNEMFADVPDADVEVLQRLLQARNSPKRFKDYSEALLLLESDDFKERLKGVDKIREGELALSEEFSDALETTLSREQTQVLVKALLQRFNVEVFYFVFVADSLDISEDVRIELDKCQESFVKAVSNRREKRLSNEDFAKMSRRKIARVYLSLGEDLFRKVMELKDYLRPGEPLIGCIAKFPEPYRPYIRDVVQKFETDRERAGASR